ncbi:hypothetical protein [Siphonobacter sp. SORGH_AS_0500]|uniref:hypothetical protein n=1 Tax=Siphonobacter sp. SORGH_AS_0500 TaxID=1864824 RepID=UPI0028580AFC|nr:hypothetical protein [Siphonobacter sp. SORGH_AS_0500]MDR6195648.1 acetate kinase [Siphonobacter sp. SORGH_AS_0500]
MISNAKSILDSLMRFEIAKKRIENLNNQRTLLTNEKLGLQVENVQLKETAARQAGQIQVLSDDQKKTRKKLFWSRVENWGYRLIIGGVTIYAIHRTFSP